MFANPLARDTDYVGDAGRHINISFGQFITAHKNHYDWNVRHPRTFHWRDLFATPTTLPSSLYRVHNYLLMDYDLSHVLFWQTNKIIFNTRTRTTSGQGVCSLMACSILYIRNTLQDMEDQAKLIKRISLCGLIAEHIRKLCPDFTMFFLVRIIPHGFKSPLTTVCRTMYKDELNVCFVCMFQLLIRILTLHSFTERWNVDMV